MEQFGDAGLWAAREFGGADLGDARLTRRLVQIATGAASQVGCALSSVCGKSGSQAISRLLSKNATTAESVLEPHIERTRQRCAGLNRILAVQDTTALDFTGHTCTEGLGPITTAEHKQGLLMHSVLAVGPDKVPVGLLGLQVWARDESTRGCSTDRRKRKTCEKESNKWLVGLDQAQRSVPEDVRVLVVGDRESDVYALFAAPRRAGVDLLVRLAQDRVVDDEHHRVRQSIADCGVVGVHRVEVPRQKGRAKRMANLELRVSLVNIRRPASVDKDLPESVDVYIVWATEKDAPPGADALDWLLLTTQRVEGLEQAVEMVEFYSMRWVVEEFHRVLKDGCKVERMQYNTVERLKPALAILCVVAWRVLRLTKQSRSAPDADVSEVASLQEVSVMNLWLKNKGECSPIRTVKAFTIAVARLGGFLGRKSDGMPGTKTIWQGLRNLEFLLLGHKLAAQQQM